MQLLIVAPSAEGSLPTGNRATARQWASILGGLGHRVILVDAFDRQQAEALVALHAVKSHASIVSFRREHPGRPIIVGIAGTDLYPEPGREAQESLEIADRIVVLQSKALERLPAALRGKARVITQSVESPHTPRAPESTDYFDVCVIGHLRDVKDPLLAARAARLLPSNSRIRIRQAGALLDPKYAPLVELEQRENSRYHWLGMRHPDGVRELMRQSELMVLSSRSEGGARVIGEAVVEGLAILATRIDGVTGLLGDDYPGLFPVGDTEALAALLTKAETDPGFLSALREGLRRLAARFDPARERQAWEELLASLPEAVRGRMVK